MLGLQAGARGLQGGTFFCEGGGLDSALLTELAMSLFKRLQLGEQGGFLLFELRQRQVNRLLGLFFKALGQACNQL